MRVFGRLLGRWLLRAVLAVVVLALLLLAPVGYNELACRADMTDEKYAALIDPAEHRAEAASYLTYPEWHIVFAYDDYAQILQSGDPQDFGYFKAITGFWTAMCSLTQTADAHGGAPETKTMDYVIGVSFTAELLAKAAYEETIGRITTWLRGPDPVASDTASARMARDYAEFLHQIPWYKYDFPKDVAALKAIGPLTFRDRERQFALGLEFGAKTAYAKAIAQAVEASGQAKLTIRSVVKGVDTDALHKIPEVIVIRATPDGIEIETPRYAAFTAILKTIADQNGEIIEIAGNDEIMVTLTGSKRPDPVQDADVLARLDRQGYGDHRWLVNVQLADLSNLIRALKGPDASLEHIFDY
ncbi:hypothetical protein [Roseobacter sp. N2S]|uniref:hypothetical protein n=1 Tax=Roseobacter sp. N2S TaxID=2663844 RepID=UPI00285A320C|nr:hypothetical protein [Roseobacter sp. N2S]MDR6263170.1 hypothetical protein [Roseobacter sp. N2S]